MTDPCEERPIEPEVRESMRKIAETLDLVFNGSKTPAPGERKYGFALLIFKTGVPGPADRMNYISNCNRGDMILAMKEFIARTPVD